MKFGHKFNARSNPLAVGACDYEDSTYSSSAIAPKGHDAELVVSHSGCTAPGWAGVGLLPVEAVALENVIPEQQQEEAEERDVLRDEEDRGASIRRLIIPAEEARAEPLLAADSSDNVDQEQHHLTKERKGTASYHISGTESLSVEAPAMDVSVMSLRAALARVQDINGGCKHQARNIFLGRGGLSPGVVEQAEGAALVVEVEVEVEANLSSEGAPVKGVDPNHAGHDLVDHSGGPKLGQSLVSIAGKLCALDHDSADQTVAELKGVIHAKTGIAFDMMRLAVAGRKDLSDDERLADIGSERMITLKIRGLGGVKKKEEEANNATRVAKDKKRKVESDEDDKLPRSAKKSRFVNKSRSNLDRDDDEEGTAVEDKERHRQDQEDAARKAVEEAQAKLQAKKQFLKDLKSGKIIPPSKDEDDDDEEEEENEEDEEDEEDSSEDSSKEEVEKAKAKAKAKAKVSSKQTPKKDLDKKQTPAKSTTKKVLPKANSTSTTKSTPSKHPPTSKKTPSKPSPKKPQPSKTTPLPKQNPSQSKQMPSKNTPTKKSKSTAKSRKPTKKAKSESESESERDIDSDYEVSPIMKR